MPHDKVGVIGSRSITHKEFVWACMEEEASHASVILAGGAKGVDRLAEAYAEEKDIPFVCFKPYFLLDPDAPYSVRHYFTRNKQIIDNADKIIAIYDGDSPGTKWGIAYARKRGKPITVFNTKEIIYDQADQEDQDHQAPEAYP